MTRRKLPEMRTNAIITLVLFALTGCTPPPKEKTANYLGDFEAFVAEAKTDYIERTPEAWVRMDHECEGFSEVQYLEVEAELSPEQKARVKRLTSEYGIYRGASSILHPLRGLNELDHKAMVEELQALVGSIDEVSTDALVEMNTALPKLMDDAAAVRSSFEPILRKVDSLATVCRTSGSH